MLISPANTSQYITSGLKYYYSVINKRSCPNISAITSLIDLSGSGNTAGLTSSSISTNNTIPCFTPFINLNNSISILSILSPFSFEYFMYIIPGASNYTLYMTDYSSQIVYIKINTDFSITLSINHISVYTSPPYSIICYSWNHIIITYDRFGNVNIYINNINVVNNNNQGYTLINFNCNNAGISDGNSYFGYTRYYNKALTSTEVNTNYYYVQTLYRNAFPNIKSGGIINNLLINTLTYNSIAVTIYYTGFSTSTAATLVISLSATGSSPLSSYSPISTLGTSGTPSYTFGLSTTPAISLTQSQPYYVVLLLSGVSTFSRYFIVNTIGTFSAYGNTQSTYQSGSISFSQNTYPSGTITVTSDSGVTLNGTNSVQITLSRGSVPSPITYTVPGSTSPPTYYLYFSLDSTTSTNYGPVTPSSFAFTAKAQAYFNVNTQTSTTSSGFITGNTSYPTSAQITITWYSTNLSINSSTSGTSTFYPNSDGTISNIPYQMNVQDLTLYYINFTVDSTTASTYGPLNTTITVRATPTVVSSTEFSLQFNYTIPQTGRYAIVAAGSASGNNFGGNVGRGIIVTNSAQFNINDQLFCNIGRKGTTYGRDYGGPGGGGTYLLKVYVGPFLIAGGGGGPGNQNYTGNDGTLNPTLNGGSGGAAGSVYQGVPMSGGGGGWSANGKTATGTNRTALGGLSYGSGSTAQGGGGFGGGGDGGGDGGAYPNGDPRQGGGGGGGGYNGGNGGDLTTGPDNGQGGTSYDLTNSGNSYQAIQYNGSITSPSGSTYTNGYCTGNGFIIIYQF
jgi:hypothetical protein